MRALVLSNMLPDARRPERGRFVRDQVAALGGLQDIEVELFEFAPGAPALVRAARELAVRYRGERFDVVHAHFGLSVWPGLAVRARARALTIHGTDVEHPRTRQITRAAIGLVDLVGAVSGSLIEKIPSRSARRRAQVLPCGVDMQRFVQLPRGEARSRLGLDPRGPYVLFPADPQRSEKRYDRALALVGSQRRLLTLGGVDPEEVPLFVNACNAVVVPSEREGFGLAVLEALACDVPVLATPVGVHREALESLEGTLCAPFQLDVWRGALEPHLRREDPRVDGRERAERYSSARMGERVAQAWRALSPQGG